MKPLLRALGLGVLIACHGKPPPPVANADRPASVPTPAVSDDCGAQIENAPPGNHDRFVFEVNDHYGYKNAKGDVVIAPSLRFAYEFRASGIAAAVDANKTFVYLDSSGKVLAQAYAYDNGPDYFQGGHARIVDAQHKIGFITEAGRISIPPRFDHAESFCRGMADVEIAGRHFQIDQRGIEIAR